MIAGGGYGRPAEEPGRGMRERILRIVRDII